MITALEGGEGSASRPDRSLTPGKTRYPLVQEAGWAPGPVWTGAENLAPPLDPRTVQPVASRYTVYATRPTLPFDPRTVQPVASRYTHYTTRPTLPFNPRIVQPVASRYTVYATRPTLPFNPRTVQPVASRYTVYATRPTRSCVH
jgi:hypothetical protein